MDPQVTIVVTERERFSYAERSLANIYENTTFPFKLVYVSAHTPSPIRHHLELEAERRGFQLISTAGYLSPNRARNVGLRDVHTKYVVFLDNDALVTQGWLEALVQCAEETEAWVVGPLYLIGEIERQMIHMAGGTLHIKEERGKRVLYDEQYLFNTSLATLKIPLHRRPCDYVELHCMLVRTDVFARLGPLDEELLSLHEHIDLCLSVRDAGGSVYIEPQAVTTYIPPPPCQWWDLAYFMLRWSEAWNVASVRHFTKKWGVSTLAWLSDKSTPNTDDTSIRFGRGHRRFMANLRVPAEGMSYLPESPLEQAELMIAMYLSVDRDCFDLIVTTADGSVIESKPALDPQGILERLPDVLQAAAQNGLNVMIQPQASRQRSEPALVRVADLDSEEVQKVRPCAFMILEPKPQRYDCWLAVDREHWRSAATLRRLGGHRDFNGSVHLAGSQNINQVYRQADGHYHRVRLVEAVSGLLISAHQLETSEALPYLSSSHFY